MRSGGPINPDGGSCTPQIIIVPASGSYFPCVDPPLIYDMKLLDSIAEGKINYIENHDTTTILSKYALLNILWSNPSLLSDSILNAFNDSISEYITW